MLSIIISSYQPNFFAALEKNIAETIGVPYEIVQIYNPGTMGICEAYNKGAKLAKYDHLLFLHEDVLFHTQNWGEKLIKHLEDPRTGIIGVAGSDYVPHAPGGWNVYDNRHLYYNFIQSNKTSTINKHRQKLEKNIQKVYAIDGVFIACTRKKYNEILFNENIKGYHGYDLDFSLRMAEKYNNYVTGLILIEHFSLGNTDKNWLLSNIQIRQTINHNFNKSYDSKVEKNVFNSFLRKYIHHFGASLKTLTFTLRFFPFYKLNLNDKISVIKNLFYFYKYRKKYNRRNE